MRELDEVSGDKLRSAAIVRGGRLKVAIRALFSRRRPSFFVLQVVPAFRGFWKFTAACFD
jgi:hypothetical protein